MTPREAEVWDMFESQGMVQGDIAKALGLSQRTVELHCARARAKLGKPPRRRDIPVKTYLVRADNGMVKIGVSITPKKRLTFLQNGSPVKLELEAILLGDREREIHHKLVKWRSHGEWFEDCAESRAILSDYFQAL